MGRFVHPVVIESFCREKKRAKKKGLEATRKKGRQEGHHGSVGWLHETAIVPLASSAESSGDAQNHPT